jgi:hypothetical protein
MSDRGRGLDGKPGSAIPWTALGTRSDRPWRQLPNAGGVRLTLPRSKVLTPRICPHSGCRRTPRRGFRHRRRHGSLPLTKCVLVYYYSHTVRRILMRLRVDAHSPIPVRQPLSEPLERAIQGGGVPRDPARPSIREMAGGLRQQSEIRRRAPSRISSGADTGRSALAQRRLSPRPSRGAHRQRAPRVETAMGTGRG